MRVLITGGYGCIGCWICRSLLSRGDVPLVYDLRRDTSRLELVLEPGQSAESVGFVEGDVTDPAALTRAIGDNGVTHVVHLAGLQVPTCRADPMLGAKVNVLGTLAVFDAVLAHRGQVARLVYASSAAVHGPPDAPDVPNTHYGVFKWCNENNARVHYLDHGLSSVGLRPWTVYGVGRDQGMTSEPTKAIRSVAMGRPHHVGYGGKQDLQFAEDVAGTFVRCLEAPYEGAKSYNMRGTVADMPEFHAALCAAEPAADSLVTYGSAQLPIDYDLDDSELERDLGPMPKTPLAEGVRRTLGHFRRLHDEGRLAD